MNGASSFPLNLLVFHMKASLRPQNGMVCLLHSPRFLESEIRFSVSIRRKKIAKKKQSILVVRTE